MSQYLFLLLVLACPLMMIFMMRGHGHGGHGQSDGHVGCGHGSHKEQSHQPTTIDELRRQRDELDRQIAAREWEGETSDERSPERV